MINAYAQTQLLVSHLAGNATRYVVDQLPWHTNMHEAAKAMHLPGATVLPSNQVFSEVELEDLSPTLRESLRVIQSTGTGMYIIDDPEPVHSLSFLRFVELNS